MIPSAMFANACALFILFFSALPADAAVDANLCGPLENAFGPFDYRTARPADIAIVERNHFDEGVATLRRTMTAKFGGDIDYTLRAFPNHHRALFTMITLAEREKTTRPAGARYTVECYLERATRFRPDDAMVRAIAGGYMIKLGKHDEALVALDAALALGTANANVYYNVGLSYFELKEYEKSLAAAHRAYAAGFPLEGLRQKLERAGKWVPAPAQK